MAQYFDKLFSNTEFKIESAANALIMVFWSLRNLKRMLNRMNTKIIILRTIWIKMRWYRTEIREIIEFLGTHLKFRDLNITWKLRSFVATTPIENSRVRIFEWPSRYSWRSIVALILRERNKHLRESVGEMLKFFPNITTQDISLCRMKCSRRGTVRRESRLCAFQEEIETSS